MKRQWVEIRLTNSQANYLIRVMQSHIDVSDDDSVVLDSKRILKKLLTAVSATQKEAK